jgi:uncharacterized OB-fold protein
VTAAGVVAADPWKMRVDEDGPCLLGSRCPECGIVTFPRRWECPVDQTPVEDVDLSRTGVINVFTWVAKPAYGLHQLDATGYCVAQVDLPEGVPIQSVLLGDPAFWCEGATVRLATESVGTDGDGRERVTYRFVPEKRGSDSEADPAAVPPDGGGGHA